MTNKMENKNDVTIERNYTVYMHICPNGKRYIGITRQIPERRWQNGAGYKHNEYFWRAIQKYEWNNFKHIIIENNLTVHDANQMEIELIAKFKSNDRKYGYNIESGGNAIGKTSKETIEKLRELNRERTKAGNNPNAKKVYCNGMIFECVTDCANYYEINKNTIYSWLKGQNKMPLDFQKLNLRYATNDDINKCEKYDINKHENKANINFNINKKYSKNVHCDNLIFKSITDCANYYEIDRTAMSRWLNGKCKMNSDFQQLNLRYATNEDIKKCENYDINIHKNKGTDIKIRECSKNVTKNVPKNVHCDNLIFKSIVDCANYYEINKNTMYSWLKGQNKMPLNFQQLNLRYATNEDLNTYPRYTLASN